MLSASNVSALNAAGLGFIAESRGVKAPIDFASYFHWKGDVFSDGQIIDTVTPRHAKPTVNDPAHRARTGLKPRPESAGLAGHLGVLGKTGAARPGDPLYPGGPRPRRSSAVPVPPSPPASSRPAPMAGLSTRPAWPGHSPWLD